MLPKVFNILKSIISFSQVIIIIGTALFTLLYDGPRYKGKGYIREVKIIKAISYSYIALGIIMFIILLIR